MPVYLEFAITMKIAMNLKFATDLIEFANQPVLTNLAALMLYAHRETIVQFVHVLLAVVVSHIVVAVSLNSLTRNVPPMPTAQHRLLV